MAARVAVVAPILAIFAALFAACGGPVTLGTLEAERHACDGKTCGDACTSGGNPGFCDDTLACNAWTPMCAYHPCDGKPCGDACAPCNPADPACAAAEKTNGSYVAYTCTADHKCAAGPAVCDPCDGKVCGMWCDPCAGQTNCSFMPGPTLCDASGKCVPAKLVTTCSLSHQPCWDNQSACGTPCSPCDPSMGDCVPPPIQYYCDENYQCTPYQHACPPGDCTGAVCGTPCVFCDAAAAAAGTCASQFCDGTGGCLPPEMLSCLGIDPCSGKQCGEPCQLCDAQYADAGTCKQSDVILFCNEMLQCTDQTVACAPSPCKECGVMCDPCDGSTDPTCMPTPDQEYCTADGQCVSAPPMCPPLP